MNNAKGSSFFPPPSLSFHPSLLNWKIYIKKREGKKKSGKKDKYECAKICIVTTRFGKADDSKVGVGKPVET